MVCYQEIIYLINLDNLVRQARAMDELQHHAASPDAAICTPGRAGATSPDAAAACHRVCTAKEKIREAGDELAWSVRRDARTQTRHNLDGASSRSAAPSLFSSSRAAAGAAQPPPTPAPRRPHPPPRPLSTVATLLSFYGGRGDETPSVTVQPSSAGRSGEGESGGGAG